MTGKNFFFLFCCGFCDSQRIYKRLFRYRLSYFVSAAFFSVTQGRFFSSRTFTWYPYCSRNRSDCGRPEARGQEDLEVNALSLC